MVPRQECALEGCRDHTRERKPYCTEHLEHQPYVLSLLSRIGGRREEEERVRRAGARGVDPDGINARDILVVLRVAGGRTAESLACALQIDLELMEAYFLALERRGLIFLGGSERGSTVAYVVEQLQGQLKPEHERGTGGSRASRLAHVGRDHEGLGQSADVRLLA